MKTSYIEKQENRKNEWIKIIPRTVLYVYLFDGSQRHTQDALRRLRVLSHSLRPLTVPFTTTRSQLNTTVFDVIYHRILNTIYNN